MKTIPLFVAFMLIVLPFAGLPSSFSDAPRAMAEPEEEDEVFPWLSYQEVVPLKRTTFVQFDEESLVDDYAFMAAVPTSVFSHKGKLYSSPLLYYDEPYQAASNADKTMNSYQGLEYFMQDWITAAGPEETELINVELEEFSLEANNITIHTGEDPYGLSAELELHHWESSEKAVVAVIGDYKEKSESTEGEINGTIPGIPLKIEDFTGTKQVGIEPIYHNFTIEGDYSYLFAKMEWGQEWLAGSEERGKDLDLQIYDWQLGEVAASENWNVVGTPGVRPYEQAYTCIYDKGDWGVAITYMPTEALDEQENGASQEQGSEQPDAIWNSDADYEITVTEYPGTTLTIPDETFFMTRDATFDLSWDSSDELTLLVREPAGAEVAKATGRSPLSLTIDQLGEGEYSVTVARITDSTTTVNFDLSYSWTAFKDRREGESLASAANGAVWATMHNCPLLYVKENSIPSKVEDALNTLGVEEVYLVDFGDRFDDDLNSIRSILEKKMDVHHYKKAEEFYKKISDKSKQNDIVITTMDPWTYWYSEEGPKGEYDGARFVGPAAYAAAHHGAPAIIMELHEPLSNSQAWHNRFWLEAYGNRKPPSVGCMVLTGHEAYDFFDEIGLDREGKESILTVAGQFDIGTAWDRMLVGKAVAGRILGTPVDTSYGVCRNVFYPLMVFANPAVSPELDPHNGQRVTGSTSVFPAPMAALVIEGGGEVDVEYPNLYTWVSQRHRFNERAGRDGYWGCDYTTASGITPYRTPSDNPIDKGVNTYGPNAGGQFWPDMVISEVVPFYGEKAGYGSVYSTAWPQVAENLNRGVLLWIEGAHGSNSGGGRIGFWNPDTQQEKNPWRSYEKGGCTEEIDVIDQFGNRWIAGPDTIRSNKNTGADIEPGYDGLVTAILEQLDHTTSVNGYQFDDEIGNLHGVGISGSSCLISNSYLHIAMIRHGSTFQVIDPWLTSWYSNFAIQTFIRDIALGMTVGEAYANGIHHVGIEYLTGQWWWDIFENVVYFGDPDLRVFSPEYSWEKPESLSIEELNLGGHTPIGATEHPNEIEANYGLVGGIGALVVIAAVAGVWFWRRKGGEEDIAEAEKI